MKKILSIFTVIFCLAACDNSFNTMNYQEVLDKEGLCNDFDGIEAIVVKPKCFERSDSHSIFGKKDCKTVIEMTICKDGTKILK